MGDTASLFGRSLIGESRGSGGMNNGAEHTASSAPRSQATLASTFRAQIPFLKTWSGIIGGSTREGCRDLTFQFAQESIYAVHRIARTSPHVQETSGNHLEIRVIAVAGQARSSLYIVNVP